MATTSDAGTAGTPDDLSERIRRIHDAAAPAVVRVGRHGGRGCGFVLSPGAVVTNAHNLRDRTTEVTFADGRAEQGRASAVDPDGDLVVLEVDTGEAAGLTWADEQPPLGDPVFSVARVPGGTRVTTGAVSGTGRTFRGPRGRRITDGVEHTAPLARGTSGSPLLDRDGHLVAISTLRLGDGFTIARAAGADLRDQIDRLHSGTAPQRRMLGVALAPAEVARRLRRHVGLPERDGLLIRQVEPESPAERAGLEQGDLITAAGDAAIDSVDALGAVLDDIPEDGTLDLHVVRGAEELDVTVSFEDG